MRFIPLHFKTAILASFFSLTALLIGLFVVSVSIAREVQKDEKKLAQLQAENLAEQLSLNGGKFDAQDLQNITNIVSGLRPNLLTVRIWKIENNQFVESTSSDDSLPFEEMSPEVSAALLNSVDSRTVTDLKGGDSDALFRIFSPIVENHRVTGAVEADERLDTISTIAGRYAASLSSIALGTILLMTVAFYLMFQKLVYEPLESLIEVMETAKAGNLDIQIVETKRNDEFAFLKENFNSMMRQIREMTAEREKRNELLSTRISEATAELRRKNEQLESANLELFAATRKMREMERLAAAGQTAAQFAHEVGTPLNLISGHAQLLKTSLPPDSKEFSRLNLITEQIERIEKIVREMLDRTRFGTTEHSPLNLNKLLQKIFDAVEPTLEEHKVKLHAELSENLPQIIGDSDRLQQVFINLFNNALDAMPDGGELFVTTRKSANNLQVIFADTGCGFSEEIRANIFQPLFTTKQRGHGTGLGLYVVREILQEHNAQIQVESEKGRGAKFILLFRTTENSSKTLSNDF